MYTRDSSLRPGSCECASVAARSDTDVCGHSAEASPALPWLRAGVQVQRSPLGTQLNQRHLRVWGQASHQKAAEHIEWCTPTCKHRRVTAALDLTMVQSVQGWVSNLNVTM